jgi:hypothetical protein
MAQNYNNYFRLSVRKTVFMDTRRETALQQGLLGSSLSPIGIFSRKLMEMRFVTPGCHLSLSLLVVISPCHSWLSRLLVTLTGERKTEKIL